MRPALRPTLAHLALAALLLPAAPATAGEVLTRGPDGAWRAHELPGADGATRILPVPGTSTGAIYDRRGRRIGTVEWNGITNPVIRDERGTRR